MECSTSLASEQSHAHNTAAHSGCTARYFFDGKQARAEGPHRTSKTKVPQGH